MRAFRQASRQRIRRRHAGHEQEQREDEVVGLETVPLHVLKLRIDRPEPAPLGQLEEREEDAVSANNPEKIEATQGIKGKQAFGFRGRRLHGVRLFYPVTGIGLPGKGRVDTRTRRQTGLGAPRSIGTPESPTTPGEINRHIRPNMSICIYLIDISALTCRPMWGEMEHGQEARQVLEAGGAL